MYLSDTEDHGSRGSLQCSSGPPVTPDSVVGADILCDGGGSGSTEANTANLPVSAAASNHNDLHSSQLLSILKTEGAEQYQVTPDYLHSSVLIPSSRESKDQGVSERCRRRTAEWMYDICDYFRLNREVVGIALFYVDRYFTLTFEGSSSSSSGGQRQVPVTRRQFQLVALTGLYLAVKLHGESRQENRVAGRSSGSPVGQSSSNTQPWNRLKFSLSICASISRNQFTPTEIEDCERDMLKTLNWHVNPVVPSGSIVDSLLLHLPTAVRFRTVNGGIDDSLTLFVYDCAKYLAELSVSVPALSLVHKPSVVAYASILHALDHLHPKSACDSPRVSEQSRQEYEELIHQASLEHFRRERSNIDGAKKILQAICPNLTELFPIPSSTPKSPISVQQQ